jgi:hypothetical protein
MVRNLCQTGEEQEIIEVNSSYRHTIPTVQGHPSVTENDTVYECSERPLSTTVTPRNHARRQVRPYTKRRQLMCAAQLQNVKHC